ncbi:MAG: hypothetical protein N2C12_08180, partial [Planctomycetales bacterium]
NEDRLTAQGGVIINAGEAVDEFARNLEQLELLLSEEAKIKTFEEGGSTWHQLTLPPSVPQVAWTARDQHIMIAVGEGSAADIIKRSTTPPPQWLTTLRKELPVERESMVSYLNIKNIYDEIRIQPETREFLLAVHALGLDNLLVMENVSGLDSRACISRSRLALDGDPRGLLMILEGGNLGDEQLATVPRNVLFSATMRVDPARLLEVLMETVGRFEPREMATAQRALQEFEKMLGIEISADLLEPLGDVWTIYNTPDEGLLSGLTVVAAIDDPQRLSGTQDQLVAFARALQKVNQGRRPRRGDMTIREFKFAGQDVYFLNFFGASSPVAPAWCIAGNELVIGLYPQAVKAYFMRDDTMPKLDEVPVVARALADDKETVFLGYTDSKKIFTLSYPLLQLFAQFACSEMQRGGFDIDNSMLPASKTISQHLQPGIWSIARTQTGFNFTTRKSFPTIGGVTSTLPLMAISVFPLTLLKH